MPASIEKSLKLVVCLRSSTSAITFDRRLFIVMPSGKTTLTNNTTRRSCLNVSCVTTSNNNTIINEVLNVHGGSPYAFNNYTLNHGGLIIGYTLLNYGGGNSWNGGNAAGSLMECNDNTGIAVHDSGNRLASLLFLKRLMSYIFFNIKCFRIYNIK